ncbi:MAG: hypothetical protein K2Z81_27945, partial [Cyanobacteria bacterium]|nr:hypothetical protein [Cyanobacteriota bacterium]
GSVRLYFEIDIPACAEATDDRSALNGVEDSADLPVFRRSNQVITHELVTEVTLKRGVPIVFFHTTWINSSKDHRLEVLFNTGAPVERSWSENHFSLVERSVPDATPLPVEKATESELDRFPSQRFFIANGQAFFHTGLPEYGVEGESVSITILRAISMLSRARLWTRGGGAGPHMPVPEANAIGLNEVSYGWAPLDIAELREESPAGSRPKTKGHELSDRHRSAAYSLAELFEGTTFCAPVSSKLYAAEHSGLSEAGFAIDNDAICMTAFYSPDGGTTLFFRLLNVLLDPQTVEIRCGLKFDSASVVRLDGEPEKPLTVHADGRLKIEFGPNQLLTIALR